MNMRSHVNRLVSSCCYQMRRIRSIRLSMPTSMAITLMNSCIIARVDYCNSLLPGRSVYQTDRVQTVLDDAARLASDGSRRDDATPVMRDRLPWLRAPQRVQFKVALLVDKAIDNLAPDYIASYCRSSNTNDRRSTLRKKSFSYGGPHPRNQLKFCVRQSPSVNIFKTKLKTFLFFKS